jgi:hypothetical protein
MEEVICNNSQRYSPASLRSHLHVIQIAADRVMKNKCNEAGETDRLVVNEGTRKQRAQAHYRELAGFIPFSWQHTSSHNEAV